MLMLVNKRKAIKIKSSFGLTISWFIKLWFAKTFRRKTT